MSSWGSFSYLFGPLIALFGLSLFVLVLRWSHAKPTPLVAPPPAVARENDYGLLVPVAAPTDRLSGQRQLATLKKHGIKASLSATTEGLRVFVWPHELDAAQQALNKE